jgi:WD40 repeat protein
MPFDGFISYSHAADGRLAPAVQRGLHRLAKPWHRRRALWIFRDQTGLAVTPKLWTSIQEAIDGSKHFVLLASPEAARSPWVNREIEHWLATKSADHILPVVTDGEWRWDPAVQEFTPDSTAVPAALRGVFAEEPLFLDLRWARDDLQLSLQHIRFRDAIAQLAAPMHGVSKDELEGEDVRQHRRARRLTTVAAVTLVLLTLVASLTGVVAVHNADRAETALADSREQQRVALKERGTAERATQESQRQQENARVQENRARDAAAETKRQEGLARYHQTLADDAAAEAKREQAEANRYRAGAAQQKAEAKRQKANAERQLAAARRQEARADQAQARAERQERIAAEQSKLARAAEAERRHQEQLARQAAAEAQAAAEEARVQREETALRERIAINRRLIGRARAMIDDDPRKALMLGVAAQRLHSDQETRDQLSHLVMSTHYAGAIDDVLDVVSVGEQVIATSGAGGPVSLWDMANAARPVRLAQLLAGGTTDKSLAASPDGRTLAVFDGGPEAVVWDVTKPARPLRKATLADAAGITAVTLSPDGHTVATSNRDKNTVLWNVGGAAPTALATLPAAYPLKFGPDGRTGVTSGASVTVWDLTDPAGPVQGATLVEPDYGQNVPDALVEFNPKLPIVAVQGPSDWVWLWDLSHPAHPRAGAPRPLDDLGTHLSSLAFAPDGTTLAWADTEGTTELWTVRNTDGTPWLPTRTAKVTTLGGPVKSLAFSSDGTRLTTAGDRRTATLWNTRGGFAQDPVAALPWTQPARIVGLEIGPDNRSLIAAGQAGSAARWDLTDPAAPVARDPLPLQTEKVQEITVSRDGRTMAVTSTDKTVTLLDVARPAEPTLLARLPQDDVVSAVAFGADGNTLAVGRKNGTMTLWDLADRRQPAELTVLDFHDVPADSTLPIAKSVESIAFTPDGHTMAVGRGYLVSLWDVTDRAAPARYTSFSPGTIPLQNVNTLAFSADGSSLAVSTGLDGTMMLLDVADPGRPVRAATLTEHTSSVHWMTFSADGRTLASASGDHTMMLWDIAEPATPVRFGTLKSPGMQSGSAALSPDGRTLAGGGSFGDVTQNITLWDATVPKNLAADPARQACKVTGRGLTADEWAGLIPELPYRPTC